MPSCWRDRRDRTIQRRPAENCCSEFPPHISTLRCYSSSLVIINVICPKWSAKRFLQGIISSFPFLYFLLHTSSSSCCRTGWQVRPLMVNFRIHPANFFWRCLIKTENENTTRRYFSSADRQDTSCYEEKRMISILFAHIAQCVPTSR